MSKSPENNNGNTPDFDIKYLYSGPGWVTTYIMDMHHFYIERNETAPLNWSTETCSRYLGLAPYTKVTVNILPLIEELNQKKRNFYATRKDKSLVHERYLEWLRGEGFPLVACEGFKDETDLPMTSRLSDNFEIDREKIRYNQTYWLTKDGWKMELEECEIGDVPTSEEIKEPIIKNEKVDEEGNYIDQATEQKVAYGSKFRESAKGIKLNDWIPLPKFGQDGDLNFFNDEEKNTILDNMFDNISQRTSAETTKRQIKVETDTSIDDAVLVPDDSVSNTDHHNFLTDRAAEGWDDDTSIGELGWDAGPEQDNNHFNSWNNEGILSKPLRRTISSW